jgi:hypothetical protein
MGRLAGGQAVMGQKQIDLRLANDGVEHGFAICQDAQGNTIAGTETKGHRYGVQIDVSCPTGFAATGLFHTHPGGTPTPSPQDIKEGCRLGIRHLCIAVPETGEMKCTDIGRRCKR